MKKRNICKVGEQFYWIIFFTAFIVIALFKFQAHFGLDLSDEGFLWYGTQRVLLGEFPIFDFMSYDPGRYFWASSVMLATNDNGVIALRLSIAIFQAIGLYFALTLVMRGTTQKQMLFNILAVLALVVWMYPRHKIFDITTSIIVLYSLVHLIENPTRIGFSAAGIAVGIAAFFGRNHGIYALVGSLGVLFYLSVGENRISIRMGLKNLTTGVIIGYTPMLILLLLVPGLGEAFWASIAMHFEQGATNLPLPLPWPWKFYSLEVSWQFFKFIVTGFFFIGILFFGICGTLQCLYRKISLKQTDSRIVAAVFLSLPYSHFMLSRADLSHIAQSIFPFLIGVLVLSSKMRAPGKLIAILVLSLSSLLVSLEMQPRFLCFVQKNCIEKQVASDKIFISKDTAFELALFEKLLGKYVNEEREFYAAPHWPGIYAAFERKSPVWEIYALWDRSEKFQANEIRKIRKADPALVVIKDYAIDGRNESNFQISHRNIYSYIVDNFDPISIDEENSQYQIFISK